MANFIKNIITFLVAFVGFIGGYIWALKTEWEPEPLILFSVSLIEIIGFIVLRLLDNNTSQTPISSERNTTSEQNVNIQFHVQNKSSSSEQPIARDNNERSVIIDSMKTRTHVLFIDDDKNFNVVKILKDSKWKNTKTITDIKSLDIPIVKETDIFFVDINGVGKLLNLEYEGLDLALMLKQKYPNKKVVIYSANKTSNSFHKAWDECDYKLEKNALPYQFQNLVEEYSLELYTQTK